MSRPTRTIKDKAEGLAFLSALQTSWFIILAPARVACTAAIVAATAGLADAAVLAVTSFADHQPPAAPCTPALAHTSSLDTDLTRNTRAPHFTPQHWFLCHIGLY